MATSEHWQQVQDLFHAALERGPGDRSGFLAEACSGKTGADLRSLRDLFRAG